MNDRKIIGRVFLLCQDLILLYVSLVLAVLGRGGKPFFIAEINLLFFKLAPVYLTWFLLLFFLDFYQTKLIGRLQFLAYHSLVFTIFAWLAGASYFYLRPELGITPKTLLFLNVIFFVLLLASFRRLFFLLLVKFKDKVVMACSRAEWLDLELTDASPYEVSAVLFTDSGLDNLLAAAAPRQLSDLASLRNYLQQTEIKYVVVGEIDRHQEIRDIYSRLPRNVVYISYADFYERLMSGVPVEHIGEYWIIKHILKPANRLSALIKRGIDMAVALLTAPVAIFLCPFMAILVKLDSPGPVIIRQSRVGRHGRTFILYKFRTMPVDSEKDGPRWSGPGDERISMIGKFLRGTHLDELPQLMNILKNDLSLVGPRPERPEFTKELSKSIPFYDLRQVVKPGLTGWAQINYRASSSSSEALQKLKYDFFYIKNQSALLDIGILLKTLRVFLVK